MLFVLFMVETNLFEAAEGRVEFSNLSAAQRFCASLFTPHWPVEVYAVK